MKTTTEIVPIAPRAHQTITDHKRLSVIDALRGLALLGIMVAHSANQYLAGLVPDSAGTLNLNNPLDSVVNDLATYLTFGKFFTIFSFLFGLSFALQMENAARRGKPLVGRTIRRLLILWGIGFLHSLFYSGDVLQVYALLGLALLALRQWSNRWLLVVGLLLAFNLPLILIRTGVELALSLSPVLTAEKQTIVTNFLTTAEQNFHIKKHGTLGEVMHINITDGLFNILFFQIFTGRIFITLGLFLLGLWAGRRRIFFDHLRNRLFFRRLLVLSGLLAMFATIMLLLEGGIDPWSVPPPGWKGILLLTIFDVQQMALSAFYLALATLFFWQAEARWLQSLVPVGRMGLTTYLSGSAFGVWVFLGYGGGQLGHLSIGASVGLGLLFFAVQQWYSHWWMRHFRYGPIEWCWRSLTYRKLQPLRK